jgi:hypothetical protein
VPVQQRKSVRNIFHQKAYRSLCCNGRVLCNSRCSTAHSGREAEILPTNRPVRWHTLQYCTCTVLYEHRITHPDVQRASLKFSWKSQALTPAKSFCCACAQGPRPWASGRIHHSGRSTGDLVQHCTTQCCTSLYSTVLCSSTVSV